MKAVKSLKSIGLILIVGLIFSLGISAQKTSPKKRERIAKANSDSKSAEKISEEVIKKLDAPDSTIAS